MPQTTNSTYAASTATFHSSGTHPPIERDAAPSPQAPSKERHSVVFGGGLNHKLPETVEGLREGRMRSCEAAAVAAALFAGIEAAILTLEKTPGTGKGGNQVILFLSYFALFLNASITITSILMIDRLGGLPFHTKDTETLITVTSLGSGRRLLGRFGAKGWVWSYVEYQWLITLSLGCFVFFGQVLVYIWIHETIWLAISATAMATLAVLPLFSIFSSPP
ncbi:hypothetical protein FRB94_001906 [Tulasnella sp. JGI-2019a]|nr:hypothetical protein FRB93_004038 [Tulasnella sp. JGI-2019a]KAG9005016.1 hypothetical protein FRB94_001906 [Tulasnella sp. JGI-2019a]KAG9031935.1 hypothetical protein FRB95_002071 [Tulasnella sp. JGI-2019a]